MRYYTSDSGGQSAAPTLQDKLECGRLKASSSRHCCSDTVGRSAAVLNSSGRWPARWPCGGPTSGGSLEEEQEAQYRPAPMNRLYRANNVHIFVTSRSTHHIVMIRHDSAIASLKFLTCPRNLGPMAAGKF